MKVYIGSDHGGFALKNIIQTALDGDGFEVTDCGNAVLDSEDDYPKFAEKVARAVLADPGSRGVLTCRSGEGMAMAANKVPGIRAALAWCPEIASETRRDNDANVVVLPADFMDDQKALGIVRVFLQTDFSGAQRHTRRVEQLAEMEA